MILVVVFVKYGNKIIDVKNEWYCCNDYWNILFIFFNR